MDVVQLERETLIRWMKLDPTYRVDFWHRPHIEGRDPQKVGYKQDSYFVRDADVEEVLAWAETNAGSRIYVVYVAHHDHADGPGLVRLRGRDPTDPQS